MTGMDGTQEDRNTGSHEASIEEQTGAEAFCYGHPDTPTRLRCTRCDKPICPRCSVPAPVGQHCVWCVAEARKSAPKVRSTMQATSPAVLAIIAISVVVYVLETLLGRDFVESFAAAPANIAFEGEYYRLITPMFLHAPLGTPFGILHILFNMYILRIYGPQVEEAFGLWKFVLMYLGTGFVAGAVSFAFGACGQLGLGASGAVFGVVGILLALLFNRRHSAAVTEYMKTLLMFVGINLVFGLSMRGIDNFAHIGGLLSGIAIGFGADQPIGRTGATARQLVTIVLVVAIGIGLVAWRVGSMEEICRVAIR